MTGSSSPDSEGRDQGDGTYRAVSRGSDGTALDDGPVARMLAADTAAEALGIRLVHLDTGAATMTMTVRPDMINGHAIGHGGFIFLLADTAFACACNTHGPVTVAAGADINYIRPVRVGDELTARAAERARYARSGIYDVTVCRGEELIAEFRGRSRTIERGAD